MENASTLSLIIDLVGHLIWPIVFLLFIIIFRKKISTLFGSLRKLRFSDIEAEFDEREKSFAEQEVSPLNDEIDGLIKRIEKLESKSAPLEDDQQVKVMGDSDAAIKKRLLESLETGPYRWRSIPTLATKSGTTEDKVLDILREDANVVLSKGKSGRQIARLKSR